MGELVTQSTTAQWLVSIEQSRTELIEAAKTGNKIATAFAMAEARVRLIESLDNEEVKARLLRMTDPRIGMVELANNPTDEDRIRVCAIAILSGFCPGEDQFAVFGGKGTAGGKLYTKEAGFRTLFAHLGMVPEVQTGHPEFVPLGTSGKKVWRVGGKASCEYGEKSYLVDFSGPAALGISGYETDNVAGIAAKARRRMLQALWAKVSPILTQDQADDADVIPEAPLAAIGNVETEPAKPDTEEPSDERKVQKAGFDGWHKAAQTRVTDAAQLATINEYWSEIANATNKDQLRLLYQDLEKNQVKPLGKKNVDELCRWCAWNAEVLP